MWKRKGKNNSLRDNENFTFLGKGVDFKGVVHFDGTVRIDGRLEGEIHTNGTLIVGENAVIKAIISAGSLICSGKINGTINAAEKIELMKPAVLIGDVRSPSFS
ncbi:polymer-forming cytoskeletal protein, partial [Nitrospiraceae bacterium AH_259_D15_M11_P09]|nr:polymer-forming cytoskeletal protein [Nitrospiraceae bacterium AH_259_D15_M11_P09]